MTQRTAWLNGEYLPLAEAKVPVLDRGFLFADGVYEVTAVLDGRLVDSAAHLARLERSAGAIGIPLPVDAAGIAAVERELIARDGITRGLIYLQLTRGGTDDRDFLPRAGMRPTLLMFTQTRDFLANPAVEAGMSVISWPELRWTRRDIKSVALLGQVMAKQAAAAAGAQEAWLVEDGFVTEGASSNAMIVDEAGTLVTRSLSNALLHGCTRAAVLALAAQDGVPVAERAFTIAEALAAREAMITSASSFVLPVTRIDGQVIADGRPGPITRRLRELYIAAARA